MIPLSSVFYSGVNRSPISSIWHVVTPTIGWRRWRPPIATIPRAVAYGHCRPIVTPPSIGRSMSSIESVSKDSIFSSYRKVSER